MSPAGWLIKDKFSMKNKAPLCRSVNYVYGFITEDAAGRMAEGHREYHGIPLPLLRGIAHKHTQMELFVLNNKRDESGVFSVHNNCQTTYKRQVMSGYLLWNNTQKAMPVNK